MTVAVDLFAGWGGFSEGARRAGIPTVYAANHWDLAVRAHAMNHPDALHVCQDLRQADWTKLPAYDLLLAGPSCPANSTAGQPARKHKSEVRKLHDEIRADPWAVISCAEMTAPKAVIVENVQGMKRWKLFPRWVACLEDLGYHVQIKILHASDFGVPQRRKRLFVVATPRAFDLDGALEALKTPEPGFGEIIDWDAGDWWPIADAPTENSRYCYGQASRLGRAAVQLVSLSTKAKAATGLAVHEPLRTVTTKDQWRVVKGDRYRPLTTREYARAQGFADDLQWPSDANRKDIVRGVGNAVPPPLAQAITSCVAQAI